MIDWTKSAELDNSTIKELKAWFKRFPQSHKKVVAVCDKCSKVYVVQYRGRPLSMCQLCASRSSTHNKKISASHTGKKRSVHHRQQISTGLRGHEVSKTARRHMSAGQMRIPYDEWEMFSRDKKYCPKFTEACRESCREKYGRRCFICNKTEKANGQKLSVHHVDMDKAQGCESNWKLVPLCKRHHATAHNNEMIARLGYLLTNEN